MSCTTRNEIPAATMPSWAQDDPHEYWDAADLFERANGRLYVAADFALPRDLDPDDQIELAHAFAQDLTGEEQLPYTLAIHAGRDRDGNEHNPHAHLMISERQNDGIERDREQWFKRADSTHRERGGAPKTREFHGREWVEHARQRWAALTNEMFERNGRSERVDPRSYERQGIDREPGEHFGPAAAHMAGRGVQHDRLSAALVSLPARQYRDADAQSRFFDALLMRLRETAAFECLALTDELPAANGRRVGYELPTDEPKAANERDTTLTVTISPGYFEAIGASLRTGRDFNNFDTGGKPQVAIVNQRFAELHLRGQDPIGQRVRLFDSTTGSMAHNRRRRIEHRAKHDRSPK